jgi:TPR repeat protein
MFRNLVVFMVFMVPVAGFAYQDDYVWQEKYKKALPKAEAGDAIAQYDVGNMYEKGNGVARDNTKAFKWYLKAAKQDHDKGTFKVGYSYLRGKGVDKNYNKALLWLNVAAEYNNVRAYYYLGSMHEKGSGVPVNLDKALRWYTRASKGGYAIAEERVIEVRAKERKSDRKLLAEVARKKRLRRAKLAKTKNPAPKTKKQNVKKLLMAGGWSKRNKPAEYLPSKFTKCKDKGKTIECVSKEVKRNIGMADISYTTKAIVYSIKDTGNFKVSYRNNVVDIKVTDNEFTEAGGKVPVKLGWQDAEHKLVCSFNNKKQLKCKKNKLRSITFNRK